MPVTKGQAIKAAVLNHPLLESFQIFKWKKGENKKSFVIIFPVRQIWLCRHYAKVQMWCSVGLGATFSPRGDNSKYLRWSLSRNSESRSEMACQCDVWCRGDRGLPDFGTSIMPLQSTRTGWRHTCTWIILPLQGEFSKSSLDQSTRSGLTAHQH